MVVMIAALSAIGVLTGEGDEAAPQPERASGPSLEQIARRVEQVRELEFKRLPRVKRVSESEARRLALRELDAELPPRILRGEERLLQLLGLLGDDGLRAVLGKVYSSEIGGFYLPGTDTLYVVGGGGLGVAFGDVVLAHELTHALEDQHFGLEQGPLRGRWRDLTGARNALGEGTATVAMVDYIALTQGGGRDLPPEVRAQALEALEGVALPPSSGLPRYFREGLVFPYVAGAQLVNRIEAGGGWEAVDRAYEAGVPASSEQVMHPASYDERERPLPVRMGGLRPALPDGARLAYAADMGEWDTEQILRDANGRERSEAAAAGWGGGAFELWELPGGEDVLAVSWEWDSARDAREFEAAAQRSLDALDAEGTVAADRGRVTLVLAPDVRLARAVAAAVSLERR